MIKNTKESKKIVKEKKNKMIKIKTGIIVSSLFLALSQNVYANTIENIDEEIESYSIESDYLFEEILDSLNKEEFDEKLMDIIDNGVLIYDNQEYEVKTLQLKQQENGNSYLTCYYNPTRDILSGEDIGYNWENLSQFGNSTIFYQMYDEGIITSKEIKVEKNTLQKYINEWDGKEHNKTPFLKAKEEMMKLEEQQEKIRENKKTITR